MRIPIHLDTLFEILLMWLFQFKFSFIVRPRKMNSCTLSIFMLSIINSRDFTFSFAVWNIIYLFFLSFRDNLFNFNQSLMLERAVLMAWLTFKLFDLLTITSRMVNRVVSSAYMIKLNKLLVWATLFISIIKSKGPNQALVV